MPKAVFPSKIGLINESMIKEGDEKKGKKYILGDFINCIA